MHLNYDICSYLHDSRIKMKEKNKKGKERNFVTTTDVLKENTAHQIQDVYVIPYVDDSRSDCMLKKKRKRHKNTDSSEDKGMDQFPNCNELLAYLDKQQSCSPSEKKFKKHKKSKDSASVDTTFALKDIEVGEIPNTSKVVRVDNPVSTTFSKKKHTKKKENFSAITSNTIQNKAANVIFNSCKVSDLQKPTSHSSSKKHKMQKETNSVNDMNDVTNSCIFNNNKFCFSAPDDEGTKSSSYMYSSIEEDNEFNQMFINDSDAEITDKSHENSFEVTQRVSKINERLKQSNPSALDFTEDFVDFEVPTLHANESIRNLPKEKQNELISQGAIIKTGKFTHDEDFIIMKNFEDFLKTYDTLDISEILGIGRQKMDYNISKFLKAKHFYVRLAKGLNDRTINSIYKRARRLLHPNRSRNRFEETEVKGLKYLHKVVNRKWIYIADALGRTADNCLQAYRWHGKDVSQGKWTKEEEEQLIAAIKKVTGSSDLSCDAVKGISWNEVAAHVPTRNFSQCRMHWAYHLAWKPGALKQKWNTISKKKLVDILRKDWYVENASEIDWLKVYESFVDVAPSHMYVQKRWLYLRSQIPGFKTMNYKGIINALCKKYNIIHQETHSAPFSSSARNRSISHSLEYMKKFTEDVRNETNKEDV